MNAINKIATTMLMVFCMTGMWAQKGDWAQLERYSDDNEKAKLLPQEQRRVVFFGNSITDIWAQVHPEFFKSNGYIGRGISGQTTYKYIVRVREDVINLKPKYVVIGGAINDIAENTNPYNEDITMGNIISIVEGKQDKTHNSQCTSGGIHTLGQEHKECAGEGGFSERQTQGLRKEKQNSLRRLLSPARSWRRPCAQSPIYA